MNPNTTGRSFLKGGYMVEWNCRTHFPCSTPAEEDAYLIRASLPPRTTGIGSLSTAGQANADMEVLGDSLALRMGLCTFCLFNPTSRPLNYPNVNLPRLKTVFAN
jgi:hypothetical protein